MNENEFWIAFWTRLLIAVIAFSSVIAIYHIATYDWNPPVRTVTITTVERIP